MARTAGAQGRLDEIDRELARLRYRHDIAMSAFLFEEATALGRQIAVLEHERDATEPPAAPAVDPATGVVPELLRPRRRLRLRK